ncbi:hypothetical protein [Streptomyces sp. NPDC096152]|uniref:hypothetical protein n=1 Tax=Streptomyces sp. NPDC096152 TaxID=3366078 RepID=UPI00381418CC
MTVHDVARRLPEIAVLREHCRSMAILEAVLNPEWSGRDHSFDDHWSENESMASMRNGSGDDYSIAFSAAGACIRGFDHESPMSPYAAEVRLRPGVLDEIPDVLRPCVEDPAFSYDGLPRVTACIWRETGDDGWRTGTIDFPREAAEDPDGSGYLFQLLVDRSPEAFQRRAEDNHEVPVDLEAVRHVFSSRPLTEDVVRALNSEIVLADLAEDIAEIGYPMSQQRRGPGTR